MTAIEIPWDMAKENAPSVAVDTSKMPLAARLRVTICATAMSMPNPERVLGPRWDPSVATLVRK